jgi:hypothetical protein
MHKLHLKTNRVVNISNLLRKFVSGYSSALPVPVAIPDSTLKIEDLYRSKQIEPSNKIYTVLG